MKITSGPWKVKTNKDLKEPIYNDNYNAVRLGNTFTDVTGCMTIADARLIAAAPDLLEACKIALEAWPNDDGPLGASKAYNKVQKAIAKAEGAK